MEKRKYTLEETKANLEAWQAKLLIAQRMVEMLDRIVTQQEIKAMRKETRRKA